LKAVILAGGEATRLRPLTVNTPKAMVPVLNRPFLEHVICHLKEHQVTDIILALGKLASPIEDYFGSGNRSGIRLKYTVEDTPLGTAGAVRRASDYLDETFAVLNGDIFTDLNLKEMASFHRGKKALATIALTPVDDPTAYGLIETAPDGKVTSFLEKPGPDEITTNLVNAGTYIIEPEALNFIPPETNFSFERQLFPWLLEQGKPVYAYPSSAYWIDIGTPENYLKLNRDMLQGKSSRYPPPPPQEVTTDKSCTVNPSAQITGPVLVGDGSTIEAGARLIGPVVIGPGCTVGEGATIEDSLLWNGVSIGQEAEVRHSIIGSNCRLNDGSQVTGSVLGDSVTLASGYKLKPGSRLWPGETPGYSPQPPS